MVHQFPGGGVPKQLLYDVGPWENTLLAAVVGVITRWNVVEWAQWIWVLWQVGPSFPLALVLALAWRHSSSMWQWWRSFMISVVLDLVQICWTWLRTTCSCGSWKNTDCDVHYCGRGLCCSWKQLDCVCRFSHYYCSLIMRLRYLCVCLEQKC